MFLHSVWTLVLMVLVQCPLLQLRFLPGVGLLLLSNLYFCLEVLLWRTPLVTIPKLIFVSSSPEMLWQTW